MLYCWTQLAKILTMFSSMFMKHIILHFFLSAMSFIGGVVYKVNNGLLDEKSSFFFLFSGKF